MSGSMLAAADRRTAMKRAEQTAAKIERAIAERGWPLGSVVGSEADLLAEYGVSRAVLREAVRLLEHDHVAYMRRGPGGGLVVAEPDTVAVSDAAARYLRYREVSPAQIVAARIAVEAAAVRAATEKIDERGIERLRQVLAREAVDPQQPDEDGNGFHQTVARLSGNPAIQLLAEVMTTLGAAAVDGPAGPDAHAAHESIAEAIIAGDVGLAQHRATRHLLAMADAVGRTGAATAKQPAGQRQSRRRGR
jgi:DNA-binding FadR family transcriptional regulator